MTEKQIAEIIERIEKLENIIFPKTGTVDYQVLVKPKTIAEILKGKKFSNGQEKITAIVGYYEKQLGQKEVTENDIKGGWRDAKFTGSYAPALRVRAYSDGLIADYHKNGNSVLTQTGEEFYHSITTL